MGGATAPPGARRAPWRTPRMHALLRGRRRRRAAGAVPAEAIVVGAGPAGLAAAAMLERAGVATVVLERTDRVAAPWHDHYDGLHLNSPALMSHSPGRWFQRGDGQWVSRDGFIGYLERYVTHHGLTVEYRTEAHRIERDAGGWRVTTSRGDRIASVVVVATGYNRVPFIPPWPGLDSFRGQVIHAQAFKNPAPFRGEDVLVAGTGNTGAEIAYKLADGGARRVRIAVRTPPSVVPREAMGLPSLVAAAAVERLPIPVADAILAQLNKPFIPDLSRYGLPRAQRGIYEQYVATDVTPIIDNGFIAALRRGQVEPVAAIARFEREHVRLEDASRIAPTVVIAATGYRRGLEPLVGHLDVLGSRGKPAGDPASGCPGAPGLFFIGYSHPFSGNLRRITHEAPQLARAVVNYLDGRSAPMPAVTPAVATDPEQAVPQTVAAERDPDPERGDIHAIAGG